MSFGCLHTNCEYWDLYIHAELLMIKLVYARSRNLESIEKNKKIKGA